MPLEATMIVLDNSEYMRNGDYPPTRFGAQSDAATTVFRTKIDSNQENTVGVMTMAGKGPEVLVTHTKEMGEMLSALHDASGKIAGTCSLQNAVAIAQLALKHRQNKNLRQRVLVFIGSPLPEAGPEAERALVRLAKKLKKNNVAVDVVAYGDGIEEAGEGGRSILKSFVDAASSSDNSHYIAVPAGTHLLSDAVISSAILAADRNIPEEAMGDAGAGGSGGANFEFGVDPSLDPELALALRMSMEEEAARQAAANASTNAPAAAPSSSAPAPATAPSMETQPAPATDDEEEAMLQQALAMSEGQHVGDDVEMGEGGEEDEELTEEQMIQRAIEMSMQGEEEGAKK